MRTEPNMQAQRAPAPPHLTPRRGETPQLHCSFYRQPLEVTRGAAAAAEVNQASCPGSDGAPAKVCFLQVEGEEGAGGERLLSRASPEARAGQRPGRAPGSFPSWVKELCLLSRLSGLSQAALAFGGQCHATWAQGGTSCPPPSGLHPFTCSVGDCQDGYCWWTRYF